PLRGGQTLPHARRRRARDKWRTGELAPPDVTQVLLPKRLNGESEFATCSPEVANSPLGPAMEGQESADTGAYPAEENLQTNPVRVLGGRLPRPGQKGGRSQKCR